MIKIQPKELRKIVEECEALSARELMLLATPSCSQKDLDRVRQQLAEARQRRDKVAYETRWK